MVLVVVAAAPLVLAVPLEEAESRQTDAGAGAAAAVGRPETNFTIPEEDLDKIVEEIRDQLGLTGEREDKVFSVPTFTSSIGNIIYRYVMRVLVKVFCCVTLRESIKIYIVYITLSALR